tara:strand:- start:160 stop:390 length:231 start_codon:yes stop_codon:yes gene_type:complete
MASKKVSSTVLLSLIHEAYKHDPEGLLSDLEIAVAREEGLVEFAQSAIDCIEMEDEDEEEVEYEETLKRVPAMLNK